MTPVDMAALLSRAFAGQSRAWSASEIADLLDSPYVFSVHKAQAFALGRAVADEAELLIIATDPSHQRAGLGRAILAQFEDRARAAGATRVFLEVAADNAAAIALYHGAGFRQIARRAAYYDRAGSEREDALILEKTLTVSS